MNGRAAETCGRPKEKQVTVNACGASHRGKIRKNNEDNIYVDGDYRKDLTRDNILIRSERKGPPHVYAVFDGLGGEACGEEASLIAALGLRAMEDRNAAEDVEAYVSTAHKTIISESLRIHAANMGTTAAAAVISGDQATVWNVGDSRVYLFRNGTLMQLSRDHSVVQMLVDRGLVKEEDRASCKYAGELIQYLGMVPDEGIEPRAYVTKENVFPGDILLLCSDGLTSEMDDEQLLGMLERRESEDAESICIRLIEKATEGRCRDNVSVIVCRIE